MTTGWRLWSLDIAESGTRLSPPVQTWARNFRPRWATYVTSNWDFLHWQKNTAYARCQSCTQPPGEHCTCGIYFCPYVDLFAQLVQLVNDNRAREDDEWFVGKGAPAITFGRTTDGPIFPDLDPGYHRLKMFRAKGFTLLNIVLWPENAASAEALSDSYPDISIWSPPNKPSKQLLEQTALFAAERERRQA